MICISTIRPERLSEQSSENCIEGSPKNQPQNHILMISPAGDANHKGRTIDGAFENQITLALAHALQNQIEQLAPHIRVIISHGAHETVKPLSDANFANRIEAGLFISLNCYQTDIRPEITLYTFSYGYFAPSRLPDLGFYTYDQAHLLNADTTQKYASNLNASLKNYTKQFDLVGIHTIPFKPLIGLKVPAIGVEIGIKDKNGWQKLVVALAESIAMIMKN